ncbi:FAD binding domain-containing protein [Nonomuraea ferruginea]
MTIFENPPHGRLRAGGTDLMSLPGTGPYVDLRDLPGPSGVTWQPDGSAHIGALTTIAEIARDERLRAAYPALTLTAGALATPQIRAVATIGGNLLQRNRCSYFRNPAFSCHQNGGDSCPARDGLGLYSAVIDTSPCVAPPSVVSGDGAAGLRRRRGGAREEPLPGRLAVRIRPDP